MNHHKTNRFKLVVTGCCLIVAGCAQILTNQYDELFGKATPKEVAITTHPVDIEYTRDIRPIFEARCVVCHACYDAPCQLKLDSYEGLLRGSNTDTVYNMTRLTSAKPTRMFEDAQTTGEWRERGFFPALNERESSAQANLQAGLLAQMLELKQSTPHPTAAQLASDFDFSLNREQSCPKIEDFDNYQQDNPLWGMPFGLPELSASEHQTIMSWLENGAAFAGNKPVSAALQQQVAEWEQWFNGNDLKQQLTARYIYEHLFLANVYFADQTASNSQPVFFKLVRSSTPPGTPIDRIATRRPYDDPEVARVYYRLWHDPSITVAKTNMPYAFDKKRREKWEKWFVDADYQVTALPGYQTETASNPFITFSEIPVESRHWFLLDEAQFTVMNFIKGPVCRGQAALSVIRDHFWVFFTRPIESDPINFESFREDQQHYLHMPAGSADDILPITSWRSYAKAQQNYLKAKNQYLAENFAELKSNGINIIWNGDRIDNDNINPNAALTVFRHFDSATVTQGLVGEIPKTAWLIDYGILERIHYLLVAGYDVYGRASHQLMTRLYMDFLRTESEMNFLTMIPPDQRSAIIDNWYEGAVDDIETYVDNYFNNSPIDSFYDYKTNDFKTEITHALQTHLQPALTNRYELSQSGLGQSAINHLKKINNIRGETASLVPELSFILVDDNTVLTLVRNSAHTNVASILGDNDSRVRSEDTLSVFNGVIGAYPNFFFRLQSSQIAEFVEDLQTLNSRDDFSGIASRFGVARNDKGFWQFSDRIHSLSRRDQGAEFGVLDYNRYELH